MVHPDHDPSLSGPISGGEANDSSSDFVISLTDRNPFVFYDQSIVPDWNLTIGKTTFNVPPLSVNVTEVSTNSAIAQTLRSTTSSKFAPGRKQRRVDIKLMFPNINEMWNGSNSLRSLITQFRSAPFLPVKNVYLNKVYEIDALALTSISISSVPGLPNTVQVDLVCYQFNWKTYVPVQGYFWDVLNMDRYSIYYEGALDKMNSYVGVPFKGLEESIASMDESIKEANKNVTTGNSTKAQRDALSSAVTAMLNEEELEAHFGPPDFKNTASAIELYYSDRDYSSELWLNSINNFRSITDWTNVKASSLQENFWNFAKAMWFRGLMADSDFDITDQGLEQVEEMFNSDEPEVAKQFEAFNAVLSMAEFAFMDDSGKMETYNKTLKKIQEQRPDVPGETARRLAWLGLLSQGLDEILNNEKINNVMTNWRWRWMPEWEIPMRRVGLINHDLKNTVIVESVTVATQNAIVSIPIEGRILPSHQHLGNLGTKATIKLKVVGERAITYLRQIFDNVSMKAMSNREVGVSGFLGVENHIINVIGMKYAMLDGYTVSTIPGQPHIYDVVLQMSDFDILQQKKEQPQTIERFDIARQMAIGHPIMRAKQELRVMNAYPDLPLPRRSVKVNRLTVKEANDYWGYELASESGDWKDGPYYDPDFYFNRALMDVGNKKLGVGPNSMPRQEQSLDGHEFEAYSEELDTRIMFSPTATQGEDTFNISARITAKPTDTQLPDGLETSAALQSYLDNDRINAMFVPGLDFADQVEEAFELNDKSKQDRVIGNLALYTDGTDIRKNMRDMLADQEYRSLEGRMAQAFPTCVVYLIDEGDQILTYKLFDTFYGLQALIGVDIMTDKEAPLDVAVLQFSNIYKKLSTPQWYHSFSLPKFISDTVKTAFTGKTRVLGYVSDLDHMKIEPGMRMQVRFGYSANPDNLEVVFNGTVAEVNDDTVMTVTLQGDGSELAVISAGNWQNGAATAGHWMTIAAPFVEPQDLIIQYLANFGTMKSRWDKRASAGLFQTNELTACAHFGTMVWDTGAFGGRSGYKSWAQNRVKNLADEVKGNAKDFEDSSNAMSVLSLLGISAESADDIVGSMWNNWVYLTEDFEIYKRNIYPGNGTGARILSTSKTIKRKNPMSFLSTFFGEWYRDSAGLTDNNGEGRGLGDAARRLVPIAGLKMLDNLSSSGASKRTFRLNTGGKTNWEIMKACEGLLPNYVLGVRPFEHRSTLFYGKQGWLYTSGVQPVFDSTTLVQYNEKMKPGQASTVHDFTALSGGLEGTKKDLNEGFETWNPLAREWEMLGGFAWENCLDEWVFKFLAKDMKTWDKIEEQAEYTIKNSDGNSVVDDQLFDLYKDFISMARANDTLAGYLVVLTGSTKLMYLSSSAMETAMTYAKDDKTPDQAHDLVWSWSEAQYNNSYKPMSGDIAGHLCGMMTAWKPKYSEETQQWIGTDDAVIEYMFDDVLHQIEDKCIEEKDESDKNSPHAYIGKDLKAAYLSWTTLRTGSYEDLDAKFIEVVGMYAEAGSESGGGSSGGADGENTTDETDKPTIAEAIKTLIANQTIITAGSPAALFAAADTTDMIAYLQWESLQDNSYYGLLAGTEFDTYSGAEQLKEGYVTGEGLDGNDMKGGAKVLSEGTRRLRALEIMTDNPFTQEFGEPVFEVREPFSRWHTASSERNIVSNGIFADSTSVSNQVRVIAHTNTGNNGKKSEVIKADASIPPSLVKEKVYDSGLNFEGANPADTVNLKNIGRYALKRALQQMYGGELVILGDPYIRPFDFFWLWDTPNRMNGSCEVERVSHHFSMETGYVTSVKVAPIVTIDDAYDWSMINMIQGKFQQESAAKSLASSVSAGFMDANQVRSVEDQRELKNRRRAALNMVDGNLNSPKTVGLMPIISTVLGQDGSTLKKEDEDSTVEVSGSEASAEKSEDKGRGVIEKSYRLLYEIRAQIMTLGGAEDIMPLDAVLDYAAKSNAEFVTALPDYAFDVVSGKGVETSFKEMSDKLKRGWLTMVIHKLSYSPLGGLITLFGGPKIYDAIINLIESEPVSIMLLNKDGDSLQAGLKGSRGIVVGKPTQIPIISDLIGIEFQPEDESTIWNNLGFTLEKGLVFKNAKNIANYEMANKVSQANGRQEMYLDDWLSHPPVISTTTVLEVYDGDTFWVRYDDLNKELINNWSGLLGKPDANGRIRIRMSYIDAPEKNASDAENPFTKDQPQYGGREISEYVKKKIEGKQVKLLHNLYGPVDQYGRPLCVVIVEGSRYYDDATITGGNFDWYSMSLNGDLLRSNDTVIVHGAKEKVGYLIKPAYAVPATEALYMQVR